MNRTNQEVTNSENVTVPEPTVAQRVECRAKPWCWSAVAFFSVYTVLTGMGMVDYVTRPKPPMHGNDAGFVTFLGCAFLGFLSLAGCCLYWMLRTFIRADETGLSWHLWFKGHAISWDEVSEYYQQARWENGPTEKIVHPGGVLSLDSSFTNRHQLRAMVARRATRASTREWSLRPYPAGRRETLYQGQQTFVYNPWSRRMFPLLTLGSLVMEFLAFSHVPTEALWSASARLAFYHSLGAWFTPFGLARFSMVLIYPIIFAAMLGPIFLALKGRERDVVTLFDTGLEWSNGERTVSAGWDQVTSFRIENLPGPVKSLGVYAIETKAGNFTFVPAGFRRHQTLTRYLKRHLPPVVKEEIVDGEPRVAIPAADGSLWFDYRSVVQRVYLMYSFGAIILGCVMFYLEYAGLRTRPDGTVITDSDLTPEIILAVGLGFFVWHLFKYLRGGLMLTGEGIEQRELMRRRFLPWAEIEEYYVDRGLISVCRICGKRTSIQFFPSNLRAMEQFQEEVRRRATQAATKEWETR